MIKPPGPSFSKVGAVAPSGQIERVRGDPGRLLVVVEPAVTQRPGFVVGEAVTARLVEPLQNRQWVVVAKNAVLTLQLPAAATGAEAPADLAPVRGETLSLQVASLTPRLTFVLAGTTPATRANSAVAVQLSDAARTLSELVHASERAPVPALQAMLETTTVLLSDPAAAPAERAQALAQAVSHSGLFYESHLLAWAEGRMPLSVLGSEPQARIAQALTDASPAAHETANAELGGLLQRQLDALDGKPLAFAGFAWPGQPAEWRIQHEGAHERAPDDEREASDERQADGAERPPAWTTQIHLDLPRLGALGAKLQVTGSQVTLAVTLDNDASAGLLATHRGRLASALQAAGLTLTGLTVQQPAAQRDHAERP